MASFNYYLINEDICLKVVQNGGLLVGVLPVDFKYFKNDFEFKNYDLSDGEIAGLEKVLSGVDGVILQGGLVINGYEKFVAKFCLESNKPVLGICAGFDLLLKVTGHDLVLDKIYDYHWNYKEIYAHKIELNKGSNLFRIVQKDVLRVNSVHKSVILTNCVKNFWRVSAVCLRDGTVEAIEAAHKRFAVGFKFHPEILFECEWASKIFREFVLACE